MTRQDSIRWDDIYKGRANAPYPPPDPLLLEFTPPIMDAKEHKALDVAAGLGQNGLWLAAQGYEVDLMDASRVALLRAQTEMGTRGLRNANLYPVDLDSQDLSANSYDLVCVFCYLQRDLFPKLRNCITSGGRIIYQTFNLHLLEKQPTFNPAYLLHLGELAGTFADWKIVHHLEAGHITQLVAIKP